MLIINAGFAEAIIVPLSTVSNPNLVNLHAFIVTLSPSTTSSLG